MAFLLWVPMSELRFSCMLDKRFTSWAVPRSLIFVFWTQQEPLFTENPWRLYDLPGLCTEFSVTVYLYWTSCYNWHRNTQSSCLKKKTKPKTLSVPSVPNRGCSLIHCPLLPLFFSFLFLSLLPCFLFPFPRRHRFLCGWGEWLNFTCAKL